MNDGHGLEARCHKELSSLGIKQKNHTCPSQNSSPILGGGVGIIFPHETVLDNSVNG